MTEEKQEMKFEDWDKVLDAKLLYNLYDDFECRLAALSSEMGEFSEMSNETMERVLKALVMFAARALATSDTALVLTGQAHPNDIAMSFIEHFVHAYQHVKGYRHNGEEDGEEDGED